MKPPVLLATLALLCALNSYSQLEMTYSQVKISIPKEKIVKLQEAGLEFDHGSYKADEQAFVVSLSKSDIMKLNALAYPYQVVIPDEKAEFLRRSNPADFYKHANDPVRQRESNGRFAFDAPSTPVANNFSVPPDFTSGSMNGYYTLTEMIAKINQMKTKYSSLVDIDTIGYTTQSRPILSVKISANAAVESGKPEVLYTGLHHAREPMGMMNLIFFMQYLLYNYDKDTMVKDLVDNRALYFIPCVNPDGYQRNCTNNPGGGGMHRKNLRATGGSNPGVDLNRNYGYGFGYPNSGSSTSTGADNYRGPSGFSEPETQAMRDYVNARNFKFALNYHAYGEYWINAYCVPTATLTALDTKIIETSGHLMTRNTFYLVGTPIQTVGYNANGSSDDWFMIGDPANHDKLYCFSPEIGPDTYAFWPPTAQIIPIAKEVMFANFQAAYLGGSFAKIEDRTGLGVSATDGFFGFTLRRLGLTNQQVNVSIVPLQNIASVGSSVNFMIANPMDTTGGSISYSLAPGIQPGQKIRFLWKMQTGGVTIVDTITKIFNPSAVFSDNMEGTLGTTWTTTGTWAFSTTSAYAGTKALATTNSGNYGNNANSTAMLKNVMDLSSANTAYASFWIRYRTETGYDKLRIQAAANGNGVGATWVTLPSSYTIAENKGTIGGIPSLTGIQEYWVRETVDLSAFAGGSTVGFRFQFQSNDAGTNAGFFIDNFEVVKSTANSTLPVSFVSFKAVPGIEKVTVMWKAHTNDQHDYFEVERSSDGVNFIVIDKVYGSGFEFNYVDNNPLNGVSYYRVKGIDKDGRYNYTAIASVRFGKQVALKFYPNPAQDQLQVSLNGGISGQYDFEIISASGQLVRKVKKDVQAGTQFIDLPVSSLSPGRYVIQVKNKLEIVATESFIKQ